MGVNLFNTKPVKHSGRFLPHRHTSYPALALIMLLAGLTLASLSIAAFADNLTSSSDIGVTGVVPGAPPSVAPSISSPVTGTHTTTTLVEVAGLCTTNLIVVISRNNLNAGSVQCSTTGTYNLQIQLYPGLNDLVAKQYDTLNQSSPPSATIQVIYDAPVASTPLPSPTPASTLPAGNSAAKSPKSLLPAPKPINLDVKYFYQGAYTDSKFNLPLSLTGGSPPFAIHIGWGDDSSNTMSLSMAGAFKANHLYAKPGVYAVVFEVADAAGQTDYLQSVIIVNGTSGVAGVSSNQGGLDTSTLEGRLLLAWPIYVLMACLLLGFWLGEEYNIQRFNRGMAPSK